MIRALLLLVLLAGPAHAVSNPSEMLADPMQEKRAEAIGQQLRCLVCQNESIEESNADLARDLRRIVRQHVVAGETDAGIMDWVVARYGDFVRLRPPFEPLTWLLWLSPLIALAVGGAAVLFSRRFVRPVPPVPLSGAEQDTLKALLKQ